MLRRTVVKSLLIGISLASIVAVAIWVKLSLNKKVQYFKNHVLLQSLDVQGFNVNFDGAKIDRWSWMAKPAVSSWGLRGYGTRSSWRDLTGVKDGFSVFIEKLEIINSNARKPKMQLQQVSLVIQSWQLDKNRHPKQISGNISGLWRSVNFDFRFSLHKEQTWHWQIEGKTEAEEVLISMLAAKPIRELALLVNFRGVWNPQEDHFGLVDGEIKQNDFKGKFQAELSHYRTKPKFNLRVQVPDMSCQSLLDSLPSAVTGPLREFRLSGRLHWDFRLEFALQNPEEAKIEGFRGFQGCSFVDGPTALSPYRLQEEFHFSGSPVNGFNRNFIVGPSNPMFLPYQAAPPWISAALIATEDMSFFNHRGYLTSAMALALGMNIKHKRFVMGGSTITMQMVKNVLLDHKKNISRKFQEFLLTELVEASLSKHRILEIYMNVIEFGPGVFGIGAAAEHYFQKSATQLSISEATFLASIVYSPLRHHGSYCRGNISAGWRRRVDALIRLMAREGLIETSSGEKALETPLKFRYPPIGCAR